MRVGGTLPIYPALAAKGIPTIGTGFALRESNVHSPNERLRVEDVDRAVAAASGALPEPRSAWLIRAIRRRSPRELADDVLERFLRYVQVDTQSDRDSETYPSTAKQLDLGKTARRRAARDRPRGRRADRARLRPRDAARHRRARPVGLIAHVDTSPDEPGTSVEPQVVTRLRRRRASCCPATRAGRSRRARPDPRRARRPRHRHDATARRCSAPTTRPASPRSWPRSRTSRRIPSIDARADPRRLHGRRGGRARHRPLRPRALRRRLRVHARRLRDRRGRGRDVLRARAEGHVSAGVAASIPARRRARWSNAIKLAARIIERLPQDDRSPETTEGREGFVHPDANRRHDRRGASSRFIARDFDAAKLAEHEQLLRSLADELGAEEPRATSTVTVEESYRNMKEFLDADPARDRGGGRGCAKNRASSRGASRSAAAPTARC